LVSVDRKAHPNRSRGIWPQSSQDEKGSETFWIHVTAPRFPHERQAEFPFDISKRCDAIQTLPNTPRLGSARDNDDP
jgi:hypothetical protein